MNESRKRTNYPKEFKQDAVRLVVEQRYSCPEVGRRLGIASSNVSRWVRQYRQDQQDLNEGGKPRKELEAEIRRLKKQLTLDALAMAYWRRKPLPGLLHHSDRGRKIYAA